MITENLATLKIHRLSKKQFEREESAGNIDETAIYMTPDDVVEDAAHPGCYYRMVGEEKEWINPPMVEGAEYRTTERYKGKPVYTKLVKLGNGPMEGAEVGFVPHTIHDDTSENHEDYNAWHVIRHHVTLEKVGEGDNFVSIPLPVKITTDGSAREVSVGVNSAYSMVTVYVASTTGDFSKYDVYAQFWYYH